VAARLGAVVAGLRAGGAAAPASLAWLRAMEASLPLFGLPRERLGRERGEKSGSYSNGEDEVEEEPKRKKQRSQANHMNSTHCLHLFNLKLENPKTDKGKLQTTSFNVYVGERERERELERIKEERERIRDFIWERERGGGESKAVGEKNSLERGRREKKRKEKKRKENIKLILFNWTQNSTSPERCPKL